MITRAPGRVHRFKWSPLSVQRTGTTVCACWRWAFNLRPALSSHMKLAAKCQISLLLEFGAAVFRPETQHEVVVETNSHGSSSYQNVGDTRGQGFEISLTGKVADDWRVSAGFTHLQAQLLSAFDTCFSTPCTRPTLPVAAGSRIPGVPDNYGALRLRHGAEFAPGARALI